MENSTVKPYILRKQDYSTHVYVDKGDKIILKVYQGILKCTITAALHILLGVGARCFEEHHDQEIRILKARVRIQANIIVKYIEKYGELRRK